MADTRLAERSALDGLPAPAPPGRHGLAEVTLREDRGFGMVSIAAHRGRLEALAGAVKAAFGLVLPRAPRWVGDESLAFLWAGDARWMAVAMAGAGNLEAMLRDRLGALAAIVGQSDGRVAIRIAGSASRDLLAKAVAIDLHPRAFRPGDLALAPAFGIPIQLCQRDDAPTYEIFVPRSYAATLFAWLVAAGAEYNVEIAGPRGDAS